MENLPPVITPFGPLKTPTGAQILHFPRRRAFVPVAAERRGSDLPPEPRRVANDRFEPEWDPLPWDDGHGLTSALDGDLREYELLAIVGGILVLLLGIIAWVAL